GPRDEPGRVADEPVRGVRRRHRDEHLARVPLHDGRRARRPAVHPGRALRGGRRGRRERVDEVLEDYGAAPEAGDDSGHHARHRVDVQQHQRRVARLERRRAERPDAHPRLVRLRGGVRDVPVRLGGGPLDGDLRPPLPVHAGVPQEDERGGGGVLMAKPNSASPWSMAGAYAVLVAFAFLAVYPITRIVTISLRPGDQLLSTSLAFIPDGATLANYRVLLFETPFL